MRVLYLILASNNREHILDELTQRQTWAKNCEDTVIWLRGGAENVYDECKKTLTVSVLEEYENILQKTIIGIDWCLKNIEFDFLVRANVSTYFSVDMMKKELAKLGTTNPKFGGHLDLIRSADLTKKARLFVNGGAVMLNRNACEVLLKLDYRVFKGQPDDWAMSQFLINKNIIPIPVKRSSVAASSLLRIRPYYRLKSSNTGEIASRRMTLVHDVLNSRNPKQRIFSTLLFYFFELKNFHLNYGGLRGYLLSLYSIASVKIQTSKVLRKLDA